MTECKTIVTPSDVNVKLQKDDGVSTQVDRSLYQSFGSLLYAAMGTRPDIVHVVGVISKYCAQSNTAHLTAANRILRYFKGTADLSLKFEKVPGDVIIGYSDAEFAGDLDDMKSTSGNIFIQAEAANGSVKLEYCPTNSMTADILTKSLARNAFERLRDNVGLAPMDK
ncbi:uncharacterized protein LOC143227492 [Tachypleus tridentatus]|uniref:uncharacterized protein LOC143227492 n=1 Tax=Tachypleus tridentatus TaxID=6853 RepID=UPI003FD44116